MSTSKLSAAIDAAARGFRVFPVLANSKIPAIDSWPDEATSDPATVAAWWATNPDFNIGIATGRGVFVIDADCKKGKPGLASLDMLDMLGLPASLRVTTPSGGAHVYLRSKREFGNRADTIADYPGIDIRGERGYVLAPGSTIDGVPYTHVDSDILADAPEWLEDIIGRHTTKAVPSMDAALVDLDLPDNIANAIEWLSHHAPEAVEGHGGDTTTYSVAAELRARGVSKTTAFELLAEHWNEQKASPPWQLDELEIKVENAFTHGQGAPGYKTAAGEFGVVEIEIGEPPARDVVEVGNPTAQQGETDSARKLRAKPYAFIEPAAIPRREWLYGRHLLRKFVSVTVAPGGIGKSSLVIGECLAMVSGKPLLGHAIERPLRVWYWNLEDPYDELQRRIQAAIQHHGLTPEDIGDRLFVNSGREDNLRVAIADRNGARIVRPVVDAFTGEMISRGIDVASVDPFVSSHGVPENDNNGMDMVAKEWGRVADKANAAIELIHHTRKTGGDEVTTDSARGGKALTDASREARVLNRMSREEAEKAGVENHRLYFRTYSDKANNSPPADKSEWFKLASVPLANGDDVGVVVQWEWPDPFADVTREHIRRVQDELRSTPRAADVRAKDWIGHIVAEVVGLNAEVASEKEKVRLMVADWLEKGWLKKVRRQGENRHEKVFVEAGKSLQEDFDAPALVDEND